MKKVDFNDLEARHALQRQRAEEKQRKMDCIWKDRVKKVKEEMETSLADIQDCRTQIQNCVNLLVPDPDHFGLGLLNEEEEKETEMEADEVTDTEAEEEGASLMR